METLMKSLLGKDQEFVVEKLKELMKNEEVVEIQNIDIDNLKEETYYLKNKLENKRDIIEDMESELDKYERKFDDAKKAVILKEIEIDELERFVAQQSEEMNILKDNNHSMITQISENIMMEKKINVQKGVINELKQKINDVEDEKATKSADEHVEQKEILEREVSKLALEVKELDRENREKINQLEIMENENLMLVNKVEFERKQNEELTMNMKKYSDNVSLSEELRFTDKYANKFDCKLCGETFGVRRDLETHRSEIHKEELVKHFMSQQLDVLETKALKQKSIFFPKLIELKGKEEKPICNCIGFCKIQHKMYNWSKPESEEILNTIRNIPAEPQVNNEPVYHEPIVFQCHSCEKDFRSLGHLEEHSQALHSEDVLEVCSTNPWGLTFFDI